MSALSAADETRLSFQVATVDLSSWTMTVRECLWNADPRPIGWGGSVTVAIRPSSVRRASRPYSTVTPLSEIVWK